MLYCILERHYNTPSSKGMVLYHGLKYDRGKHALVRQGERVFLHPPPGLSVLAIVYRNAHHGGSWGGCGYPPSPCWTTYVIRRTPL